MSLDTQIIELKKKLSQLKEYKMTFSKELLEKLR